jgi:hypothetical protein
MGYIGAGISRFNTADELTVTGDATIDTTTLVVDSTNNRVGVKVAPERDLHVKGSSGDPVHFKLEGDASDYARIMFDDGTDDNIGEIRYDFGSDFMQFTANAAERMRLTSAGLLGLGTSSPADTNSFGNALDIQSATGAGLYLRESDATSSYGLVAADQARLYLHHQGDVVVRTGGATTRMTINSSGNVGIGAAPNATFGSLLYLQGTPAANKPIFSAYSTGNSNNAGIAILNDSGNRGIWTEGSTMRFTRTYEGNSTADMTITSGGNVNIGSTTSTRSPLVIANSSSQISLTDADGSSNIVDIRKQSGPSLTFDINGGEKMRLSGTNLSVGTTTTDIYDSTSETGSVISDGYLAVARASSVAYFNRLSSDGLIVDFRKSGSVIGEIRTYGDDLAIGTGDTGLRFIDSTNSIAPSNVTGNTDINNSIDLGYSSRRFKDGYFANAVKGRYFQNQDDTNTYMEFPTGDIIKFATGGSERARFDNSGNFQVGATTNNYSAQNGFGVNNSGSTYTFVAHPNGAPSSAVYSVFSYNGGIIGSISQSGTTAVSYNTGSDRRLKQDIEPLAATDKLMAMNPVSYTWKADPDGPRSMGFIAQEMQEIMPDAVTTGNDEDSMMGMDYGRITPILVSALQDAHRKIEELAAEIAELRAN